MSVFRLLVPASRRPASRPIVAGTVVAAARGPPGRLSTTAPADAASDTPAQVPLTTSNSTGSQSAAQLSCAINDTSGCLTHTATSTFTTTHEPCQAHGRQQLQRRRPDADSGLAGRKTVTIDGATMTLPKFGTGTYDNMPASGQTVTLPGSSVVNTGDAVVLPRVRHRRSQGRHRHHHLRQEQTAETPTATPTHQDYRLDTVPDSGSPARPPQPRSPWSTRTTATTPRPARAPARRPTPSASRWPAPVRRHQQHLLFPEFTNGVQAGQPALHIIGLGVRPITVTGSGSSAQHWVGTWASGQ